MYRNIKRRCGPSHAGVRSVGFRARVEAMQRLEIRHTWDGAPARPGERVRLELALEPQVLRVGVDAPYHGDPPPPGPAGPTDGLWEFEVVELFVLQDRVPGTPRYTEIELGPHGHHLVLQLAGIRTVVKSGLPLPYQTTRAPGADRPRWRGEARLDASLLPPPPHRLNAYAIHGVGASRRYLALYPGPTSARPDFHRLETFQPARW